VGDLARLGARHGIAVTVLPMLHVDGERAYSRVRRGEQLELQPRSVTIQRLELVGWDAERVVAEARVEFERVHRDLVAVSRQLWHNHFPGRPLPPEDAAGRRELVRLVIDAVNRDHGAPETLVRDARETVAGLKSFIRSADIVGLPEPDRCQVLEMPEFRRGNSAAYLENALPLDPSGPSTYAISPPPASWDERRRESFLEEYNRQMLRILTIHEAYPGHYVQFLALNASPVGPVGKAVSAGSAQRAGASPSRWRQSAGVPSVEATKTTSVPSAESAGLQTDERPGASTSVLPVASSARISDVVGASPRV
jgi:hypothetical protein